MTWGHIRISQGLFSNARCFPHTCLPEIVIPYPCFPTHSWKFLWLKWSHSYWYSWLVIFLKVVDVEHHQQGGLWCPLGYRDSLIFFVWHVWEAKLQQSTFLIVLFVTWQLLICCFCSGFGQLCSPCSADQYSSSPPLAITFLTLLLLITVNVSFLVEW